MAEKHIVYNSRIFCTRWNGLEKGSIFDDALDDKEYEGNLIYLLKNTTNFIKNDSKVICTRSPNIRLFNKRRRSISWQKENKICPSISRFNTNRTSRKIRAFSR